MSHIIEKVILDTFGYDAFIALCEKKEVVIEDIEVLLSLNAYDSAIRLMGKNWGMASKEAWIECFSYGFECNDINLTLETLSEVQIQWSTHLRKVRSDIESLINTKYKIQKAIESNEFLDITSKYIPDKIKRDELEISLLVFGPNAGGKEKVILDVEFFSSYTEEEISRIIAHELHHILRSEFAKDYSLQEEFWGIEQALYWFESEGAANLCNFNETSKIYSDFGYGKLDKINKVMENMGYYIREMDSLILDVIQGKKKSEHLVSYLIEDVKFHVISYYMACIINSTLGNNAIKEVVGDPLRFMNMYQKACKENKGNITYALTDETILNIQVLYNSRILD